jgi:hypothetical protein
MAGMQARHKNTARWRANGAAGVALRKAHSLGRELIDIRSFDSLLAITAEFAVTQVIRENKNNVGFS